MSHFAGKSLSWTTIDRSVSRLKCCVSLLRPSWMEVFFREWFCFALESNLDNALSMCVSVSASWCNLTLVCVCVCVKSPESCAIKSQLICMSPLVQDPDLFRMQMPILNRTEPTRQLKSKLTIWLNSSSSISQCQTLFVSSFVMSDDGNVAPTSSHKSQDFNVWTNGELYRNNISDSSLNKNNTAKHSFSFSLNLSELFSLLLCWLNYWAP